MVTVRLNAYGWHANWTGARNGYRESKRATGNLRDVGRPQPFGVLMERSDDVSIEDYLAGRRALPHLRDLAPQAPAGSFPAGDSDGARLVALARQHGDPHADIRLLVNDGARYLAPARELAEALRCDVYLPPAGAHVRYVHESSSVTGESWDAIAVDTATGEPADWITVRPAGTQPDVPEWFVSTRGRLRQNTGVVKVPLPDGLAFATRTTFRDTADLAGLLHTGPDRVTTVAVNADIGRFEIARFGDAGALLGGVEFATMVAASLDEIQPDLQLLLSWPTDPAACTALDVELMRLADALNRTVWVPRPAGAAWVLPGCGEFVAVDAEGRTSQWRAYASRLAAGWQPSYGTDLDGRLVPLGEVDVTAFPGVPFVSVPPGQREHLRTWYEAVATFDGLFTMDLAVLDDGRLGVAIEDGTQLAIGGRELRRLLREAGWGGEDVLLLAQPRDDQWEAVTDYLRHLASALAVDMWLQARGLGTRIQPDGALDSEGAWHRVPHEESPPPVRIARTSTVHIGSNQLTTRPVFMPASPTVQLSTLSPTAPTEPEVPHGVTWLPPSPMVNPRRLDLFVWTASAAASAEGWTVESPDLFVLTGQDPLRLAYHHRAGYLLRLRVPGRGAVDLLDHAVLAPAPVRRRVRETGSTHLVPLAWLADAEVTGRFDLDGDGGVAARQRFDADRAVVRFAGADHGVPGLPNDVVNWPAEDQRADTPSYVTLPDRPGPPALPHDGFVALSRQRPGLTEGHRVLEVKVRRRRAVDVAATLERLAGLPVAGPLDDFGGLDLVLSKQDLSKAVVTKIWRYGEDGEPILDKLDGGTLADALR